MSDNDNIIENGQDNSRRATDIPDRMLIGNGRDPKPRTAEIEDQVEDDTGDVDESQVAELEEDSAVVDEDGNGGTDPSNDDELIDAIVDADLVPREVATQTQQQPQTNNSNQLHGEFLEEYNAVVEAYGEELADKVVKPRLLREQRLEAQLAPFIQTQQQALQKQAEEAQKVVLNFFDEMSNSGFNSLYGTTDNRKPVQNEACRRVLDKAIQIKTKVESAGLTISPRKALQKAHESVWGNSPIGKRVRANQNTMEQRATNTTLPSTRGGLTSNKQGSRQSGDPYAKVRNALKRSGMAR